MKKVFVMMMAMAMAFSVAACGGSEEPVAEEVSLVMQEAGYVSMLVPDDYEAFSQYEGFCGAPGPGSSIIVSDPMESDTTLDFYTEDGVIEMVSASYPDAELLAYENPAGLAGTDSVCFTIQGSSADEGAENTVTYVCMYYELDGVRVEQMICYTYRTGGETSLEAAMPEVLDSITIG